jgi:hypothetical protein
MISNFSNALLFRRNHPLKSANYYTVIVKEKKKEKKYNKVSDELQNRRRLDPVI